jgi:tetratricopeptide (TPR) repeat protein
MTKKVLSATFIFIMLFSSYLIPAPQTDFDEANSYYEKGDYENSIRLYEKILAEGYANGEVYYNLGNSYYKSGDIALTIVNYERALKFMPGDADLAENLKIARLSLADKIEEASEVPFFTLYSDLKTRFNIFSIKPLFYSLLFALSILISIYIFFKNNLFGKLLSYLIMALTVVFLLSAYVYFDLYNDAQKRFGVISEDTIPVLSSPDENVNSKELFFLHKGTKAQITRSNEQWLEIALDEEKKGWVKKESIIEI